MGCGGTQTVHLPPLREKGSSGDFPSSLWACYLNHGGLLGFWWAYFRVRLLLLPASASLLCRVKMLGRFPPPPPPPISCAGSTLP